MSIINYLSVTIFGVVLVIWFCNIKITIRTLAEFLGIGILGGLINLYISKQFGAESVYLFYPFTMHIPLILYCGAARHKRPIWQSVFAVTMAYMLTTPRKWLFVFSSQLFGGTMIATAVCDVAVTVVLLAVAYWVLVPKINAVFYVEKYETNLLCIPPVVFYLLSYVMSVYTDLIYYNERWTIAVLTTAFSLFFTVFELYYYSYMRNKSLTQQSEKLLSLQLKSLQRLSVRIAGKIQRQCKNELLNTVLALYRSEGKSKGLNMIFSLNLQDFPKRCDNQATLLIAELLEDAVQQAKKYVSLTAVMRNGQLCIMLEYDGYVENREPSQEIAIRYGDISVSYENEKGIQLAVNI